MKLLFNTEDENSEELKDLLGFVDKDLNAINYRADLKTATNELIDLVGQEIYDKAVELYLTEDISEEDEEFLYVIRYPIAVNAHRMMIPSSDLAHTNNGRKMRQDEKEKLPFEWMIDRDNANLERRYYRALDELIKYLDKQPLISPLKALWINSEAFKTTNDLFIRTVAQFDKFFTISSRLLLIKLSPGISDCELYDIRPRIGLGKFSEFKLKLKSSIEIVEPSDLELLNLIRKASVASAMAWAMNRLSVQLFPEGVLQHYTSDRATTIGKKPTLKNETEVARQAFESDKAKAIMEIERLLAPAPTVDETISVIPEQNFGDHYFST